VVVPQALTKSQSWTEHGELAALFFLHGMAMGIWLVPLSRVLAAHGMEELRPAAYATSALAAFVSPLVFGAMADHHAAPARGLRWLSTACAGTMALVSWSIGQGWAPAVVLAFIQIYALAAAPTFSITSTIVFCR